MLIIFCLVWLFIQSPKGSSIILVAVAAALTKHLVVPSPSVPRLFVKITITFVKLLHPLFQIPSQSSGYEGIKGCRHTLKPQQLQAHLSVLISKWSQVVKFWVALPGNNSCETVWSENLQEPGAIRADGSLLIRIGRRRLNDQLKFYWFIIVFTEKEESRGRKVEL